MTLKRRLKSSCRIIKPQKQLCKYCILGYRRMNCIVAKANNFCHLNMLLKVQSSNNVVEDSLLLIFLVSSK